MREAGFQDDAVALLEDYSLEMTGKDVDALVQARDTIPAGTRINVTFLGNEDLPMRVSAVEAVLDNGFLPVPHLSARRLRSVAQLEEYLQRLQDIGGSERVFIVGGDPAEPEGPFADALSVVRTGVLPTYGVREVGITGYPEGHPDIDSDVLWRALMDKCAEIAAQRMSAAVTTQFAFATDPVVEWIRRARREGVDAPIRVGVPGPAGVKRLLAFARRFGVGANATIVRKYGFSLTNLMGTAGPDRFITDLGRALREEPAGDVKVHLYTFGGLDASARWVTSYRRGESASRAG